MRIVKMPAVDTVICGSYRAFHIHGVISRGIHIRLWMAIVCYLISDITCTWTMRAGARIEGDGARASYVPEIRSYIYRIVWRAGRMAMSIWFFGYGRT